MVPARFPEDAGVIRALLREYADGLGVDLCFQGFEAELAGLPGDYAEPAGTLLLARDAASIAGCGALRRIDPLRCEMKRLYVRASHRGRGLGEQLALALIEAARSKGYRRMCLDTLPSMVEAHGLYRRLGFEPIAPYRPNPVEGALFMEKTL